MPCDTQRAVRCRGNFSKLPEFFPNTSLLDAISGVMTILKFQPVLASGLPHFLAGWRPGIQVYRDGYSRHRH
jgi:hypothetical protein